MDIPCQYQEPTAPINTCSPFWKVLFANITKIKNKAEYGSVVTICSCMWWFPSTQLSDVLHHQLQCIYMCWGCYSMVCPILFEKSQSSKKKKKFFVHNFSWVVKKSHLRRFCKDDYFYVTIFAFYTVILSDWQQKPM